MSGQWIAGKNPVLEALKSGRDMHKIWIAEGSQKGQMRPIIQLANEKKVQIQFVPKQKLDQMTKENHQGVIAEVAAYQYAEIDDLFKRAEEKGEDPFFSSWMNWRIHIIWGPF